LSEIAAAVDRVLDRHASKHVGVAVGVRAETELHTCGRGRVVADRPESPSANTIFEIGSITKVFTAVLLADLVQRGLVALEDPVQRYLPEGVRLPVRGQPVTLADLATHSAGFPGIPKGMLRRALTERANPWATFA
jgi:CubicO group peptidase (beta-lactamase class C family)